MPETEESRPSASRRAFLIGTGAAVAWTAPVIMAAPAAAQTSGLVSPPFRSTSNATADPGSTSATPALPAGTADGDLILAIADVEVGQTIATPAGWSNPYVNTSTGNPASARFVSYVFAYTASNASAAPTTFTRAGAGATGIMRVALATFMPAPGFTGVSLDNSAVTLNVGGNLPPYPALTVNSLSTVVYLGAAGLQGSARWSPIPTPGDTNALGTIAQGLDLAISYSLDVTASTPVRNGALITTGGGATTDTNTYAVSLVNT